MGFKDIFVGPKITQLTTDNLKEMFIFSFERIKNEKENINKINVFPVPDQDTGTNIFRTLEGIKKSIENKKFNNIKEISDSILDAALSSAQGNSGVIYTGFLAGFLPTFNENPITAQKLAVAFKNGAERAKEAIQNPKEGTVLDVIFAARDSVSKSVEQNKDNIFDILKQATKEANEALLETREKMGVLKKANVVDAGGLAFLMILESWIEAISGKKVKEKIQRESEKTKKFVQIISQRYEVVALIKNPNLPEKEIREKLKNLGNCLDIVSISNRMKIHIHTDYPEDVKSVIRSIGEIESMREEDMAKEIRGEESVKKVLIGIVTDEIADLTQKIVERYQIEVIPFKINWPEEGKNLPEQNIYQKMREAQKRNITKLPKTSQASPKEFLKVYQKQLERFEKVLCITLSSKISGGYNSAIQAREMLPEKQKNKVYVLDSYQATCGQALLVLKAIELIQSQMEIDEVVKELKKEIPKIHLYGFMADPKWLEWGGRMSHRLANWVKRFQKIHLFPFIGIKKGEVKPIGITRAEDLSEGLFKQIEKDSKKARKEGKQIRVVITHCDNLEDAKKLKERLKEIKAEVSFINLTGSVVGVHVGPGSLIAAWTAL